VAVLVLAAVVGVIASLAAWCFLELLFYMQQWVFTDIPKDLGFDHGPPLWWYLPVLAFAGLVAAFAIARLPGDLPGVLLAAIASIGLGLSPPGSGRWSRSGWGR
jgi:H+/Cl- antiporter ClcA